MDIYSNFSIEDLILLSIFSIKSKGKDCSFERLVKECFTLFPKKFSFTRYPQWPDSLKLDRPLRKLQQRGLIIGSRTSSFGLSLTAKKKCQKLAIKMKMPIINNKIHSSRPRKEKQIINRIKKSNLYKKFLKQKQKTPTSNSEIRSLFLCTMETPLRVVIQNIKYIKDLSEETKDRNLTKFLSHCIKTIQDSSL